MELKRELELEKQGNTCFYLELKGKDLPFVVSEHKLSSVEDANEKLQKFVRLVEKKFDSIWYIGTDYFGTEVFERFMFQHGGFMEISLNGKIKSFFVENKIDKMKEAIRYAVKKMTSETRANNVVREVKAGKRLISLRDSILRGDI